MCFSSPTPPAVSEPAAAPPPPAIPTSQSAGGGSYGGAPATAASPTLGAEPVQQIGFARKKENKRRFGKTSGPSGRREAAAATTTGDVGSGIKM